MSTGITAKEILTIDLNRRPALRDHLLDRDCAALDGKCDCETKPGQSVPDDCKYLKREVYLPTNT